MRIAIVAGSNLEWPVLSGPVQLTAFWSARLAIVAGLALAAVSPSLAQTAPPPGAKEVPLAREGNVYDHRSHQPTRAETNSAEVAAGVRPPSTESTPGTESEVQQLLRQLDELDKQSEENLKSTGGR
jgi:hypothetical protein